MGGGAKEGLQRQRRNRMTPFHITSSCPRVPKALGFTLPKKGPHGVVIMGSPVCPSRLPRCPRPEPAPCERVCGFFPTGTWQKAGVEFNLPVGTARPHPTGRGFGQQCWVQHWGPLTIHPRDRQTEKATGEGLEATVRPKAEGTGANPQKRRQKAKWTAWQQVV